MIITLITIAAWLSILSVAIPLAGLLLYGMLLVLLSPVILVCQGLEALILWLRRDKIRQRRDAYFDAKWDAYCKSREYEQAATRWRAQYGYVRHFLTPVHLPAQAPHHDADRRCHDAG